jgi:hypothetical protein
MDLLNKRRSMRYTHRYSAAGLVSLFLFLAELLLTLRVILKFFFTTANSSFVHWGFTTTDKLLEPIRWVFNNPTQVPTGNWYVDFPTLFAMAFYAVLASLSLGLVGGLGAWSAKNWVDWKEWRTMRRGRGAAAEGAATTTTRTTTRRRR